MEEQEVKVSKYNSGVAIILRLDALWKDTHTHSRAGNYSLWNSDLDRVWCELSRDLDETKYKKVENEFSKIDEELENLGSFKDYIGNSFDKLNKDEVSKRNKQYKVLMKKELFLRRLENDVGKGTAWDEGDEDDFE